jgi:ubiquinone/menaquinone biosynthesis C-methylase UbiE
MSHRAPNFDRVARIYRWAEYLALGPLLQRVREHFLPRLQDRMEVVALGDGDGRFLVKLLQQNPGIKATAVDSSATMLHLLRTRCRKFEGRLCTIQASALDFVPPPSTDLIVTHFFLDCLTQPELNKLTHNLAARISTGTLWLVSDFSVPSNALVRPFAALYVRSLYLAFRILTGLRVTQLPNPQAALDAAGFERLERREFLCGVLYTELWRRQ